MGGVDDQDRDSPTAGRTTTEPGTVRFWRAWPRWQRALPLIGGIAWVAVVALLLLPKTSLLQNPGYVLIGWGRWQLEMTAIALLLLFLFGWLLFYGLIWLLRLPYRWPERRARQKLERAHRELLSGLEAFARGDFSEAEDHFLAAASEEPHWLYHLYAARSVHLRGAFEERNRLLQQVREANRPVALLAEARWALEVGNLHHALEAIDRFLQNFEPTPFALRLACRIYREAGQREKLGRLRPELEKRFSTEEISELLGGSGSVTASG